MWDVVHIRYFRIAPSQFLYFVVCPIYQFFRFTQKARPIAKRRPPSYLFQLSTHQGCGKIRRVSQVHVLAVFRLKGERKRRWSRRINVRLEELAGMACLTGSHKQRACITLAVFPSSSSSWFAVSMSCRLLSDSGRGRKELRVAFFPLCALSLIDFGAEEEKLPGKERTTQSCVSFIRLLLQLFNGLKS